MTELLINGRFLCQRATGVQRVAREFVLALDRLLANGEFAGLRPRLIAPAGADLTSLEVTHIALEHLGGGTGYFWEQVALPARAGRRALLCLGNAGPILAMIGGGHVAVMLHDQSYRLFPQDYSAAYRAIHTVMGYVMVRRARPLITVSNTEAAAIRLGNGGRPDRLIVAPNGSWMNDAPVEPTPPAARAGFVLHVGGFSERKNVEGVFAAARMLAEAGVATRLVGQPNARAEAFLATLDPTLRALVTFTGYVDNDALVDLYRDAACLIYPSFYEASGLPPSEAMSFGCPVIVSDLPVLRERCGDAALYCDPHDPGSIVAHALDVVRNPARAADLSTRGVAQARRFTWENQARVIVSAVLES